MIEYLPSFNGQLTGFLYSAGIGFALGILYELIRIIFFVLSGSDKKFVLLRDIILMSVCFAVSFVFFLVKYNGNITFYAVLGEAIGGVVAFKSFDSIVSVFIKRVLRKIRGRIISFAAKIKALKNKFVAKLQNIQKNRKKVQKKSQKVLHNQHKIVYNQSEGKYPRSIIRKRGDRNGRKS